jgi:hypothetical protein
MGMFDDVTTDDPRFVCVCGHAIGYLQTKDLACTLGLVRIEGDRVSFEDAMGLGAPHDGEFTGSLNVYDICESCDGWSEFDVEIAANVVLSVTRLSKEGP